jgi:hypothetical protein
MEKLSPDIIQKEIPHADLKSDIRSTLAQRVDQRRGRSLSTKTLHQALLALTRRPRMLVISTRKHPRLYKPAETVGYDESELPPDRPNGTWVALTANHLVQVPWETSKSGPASQRLRALHHTQQCNPIPGPMNRELTLLFSSGPPDRE